jgi:uncharacterized protein HemY
MARPLGNVATTAERFEQASLHFEKAIRLGERRHAPPWIAHARHEYAQTLITYGDHEKAQQQLAQAIVTYRELRMGGWIDRALRLQQPAAHPSSS